LCSVGSVGPGGGFIFFVDSAGEFPEFNYLEVAPTDASTSAVFAKGALACGIALSSNCETNHVTSIAAARKFQEVGRGQDSASRTLSSFTIGGMNTLGTAVKVADDYTTSLADDWYLPNKAELDLVYQNIHRAGIGSFTSVAYWTSSELASLTGTDPSNAWVVDFRNTQLYTYSLKNIGNRVRAIRSF
jgi:hypothetical protein